MAAGAVLRKIRGQVGRVGGAVVIRLVATPARRVGSVQGVVIAHMALGALQVWMSAHQGEASAAVVEGGTGPVDDRRPVADGAILREARGLVRWVGRSVVIGLVAVPARPVGDRVIAELGGVTLRALQTGVRSG